MKKEMFEPRKRRSAGAKQLRFSEFSQLVVTESKSRENLEATWYTGEDVRRFKRDAHSTAKSLRGTRTARVMKHVAQAAATASPCVAIHVHGMEYLCGIEHLISPEVAVYMLQKRKRTIARVLEEQKAQEDRQSPCPYRLARVSKMNSSFSKEWCSRIQSLHA